MIVPASLICLIIGIASGFVKEWNGKRCQILFGWHGASADNLGPFVAIMVCVVVVGDERCRELSGLRVLPVNSLEERMLLYLSDGGSEARIANKDSLEETPHETRDTRGVSWLAIYDTFVNFLRVFIVERCFSDH